jgi:gliding motility-associated lipoprotein GldH
MYKLVIIAIIFLSIGCNKIAVYEKITTLPQHSWKANEPLQFDIEITDTNSYYQLYYVLRHTNDYPFNNLFVQTKFTTPGDTAKMIQEEIVLTDGNKTWLGQRFNNVIEQRLASNSVLVKPTKPGLFTVQLTNIMRLNPLPNLMQVGVRVQKFNAP